MVRSTRIELVAYALGGRRSIQLSYERRGLFVDAVRCTCQEASTGHSSGIFLYQQRKGGRIHTNSLNYQALYNFPIPQNSSFLALLRRASTCRIFSRAEGW